jgi:hypothetical protein
MDWLTDLIRRYPELAPVQARLREMVHRYAELRQKNIRLRELHECMLAEMECLRRQLAEVPWDCWRKGARRARRWTRIGMARRTSRYW